MAWPDVLRWLALIVGGAASLMGLVWTLRCIFRPWRREAAREAADGLYEAAPGQRLPAAMKGLVDRIERVDARGRGDTGRRWRPESGSNWSAWGRGS